MSHHMTAAQEARQHIRETGSGRYAPVRHPEHDLYPGAVTQPVAVIRDADRIHERHLDDDFGLSVSMSVGKTWRMPDGRYRHAEIVSQSVANFEGDANDWADGGRRTWEGIEVESGLVDPGVWEEVGARLLELRSEDTGEGARTAAKAPKFDYYVTETYVLTEYDRHPDSDGAAMLRTVHQEGDLIGDRDGSPFSSVDDTDRAVIEHINRVGFDHLIPDPDLEEWFDDEAGDSEAV